MLKYNFPSIRMAEVQKLGNIMFSKAVSQQSLSYITGRKTKQYNPYRDVWQ